MLTNSQKIALADVAQDVGTTYGALYKLISFESGFDPFATNPISGAKGLIQFTNTTSRAMGYSDSAELVAEHPSVESQLYGPVRTYLQQWDSYPTEQSLYMAVFYPAARFWNPSQTFPENVRTGNPGIDTVQSYIDFVNKKTVAADAVTTVFPYAVLAIGGILLATFLRGKK